jgi:hypothetical protein
MAASASLEFSNLGFSSTIRLFPQKGQADDVEETPVPVFHSLLQ